MIDMRAGGWVIWVLACLLAVPAMALEIPDPRVRPSPLAARLLREGDHEGAWRQLWIEARRCEAGRPAKAAEDHCSFVWLGLAQASVALGRLDEAELAARLTIAARPPSIDSASLPALRVLAQVHERRGDLAAARKQLWLAMEVVSDADCAGATCTDIRLAQADFLIRHGLDLDEARRSVGVAAATTFRMRGARAFIVDDDAYFRTQSVVFRTQVKLAWAMAHRR